MNAPSQFRAFVAEKIDGDVRCGIQTRSAEPLAVGEVRIAVEYSTVNYKDALATTANGRVARTYPLVPGIDMAGTVVESAEASVPVGSTVLAHGHDLGVSRDGGYAEYATVPAAWVVPLPDGMTPRQAMILGTAGFTAALSVQAVQQHGIEPDDGPVLVTGAAGGVGSVATALLGNLGYSVVASTGRPQRGAWLLELGAERVTDRLEPLGKPLVKEQWAGVVDTVGGTTLAAGLAATRYGGIVTACGNTGGTALDTTVFPFILRGVTLRGIDSVACDRVTRAAGWRLLHAALRLGQYDTLAGDDVDLERLPAALSSIRNGGTVGRTIVRPSHQSE